MKVTLFEDSFESARTAIRGSDGVLPVWNAVAEDEAMNYINGRVGVGGVYARAAQARNDIGPLIFLLRLS